MTDPNSPPQETEAPAPEETPESSSPEQAPPEDSQAQVEASPDADAEADGEEGQQEEAAEGEQPAAAKEPEKHKRAGGYQRKIDRLERQNQQLMEMLQRNAAPQPPAAPDSKPKTPQETAAEQFHNLVQERVRAELAQREAAAHQQRLHADLQKQMAEARARHADFDDALEDVSHIPVPEHIQQAILLSDTKAEIMYTLAKNPAELARLSALPPFVAAREIGKLEAKLASGPAPQTPKPAARPPAPPSKVGGKVTSTRSLDDLPLSEYKRHMRSRGR